MVRGPFGRWIREGRQHFNPDFASTLVFQLLKIGTVPEFVKGLNLKYELIALIFYDVR